MSVIGSALAWAAMTKCDRRSGLNRHFSRFYRLGSVLLSSVPNEGSLPDLEMSAIFAVSSHGKESVSSLVSFLIRTLFLSDQSLTLVNSFNLNYLLTLNTVILGVTNSNI